jgi:hypothetical protein
MKTGLWILIVGLSVQIFSGFLALIFLVTGISSASSATSKNSMPNAGHILAKILCVYILGGIGGLMTFVGVVWCVIGYARCPVLPLHHIQKLSG